MKVRELFRMLGRTVFRVEMLCRTGCVACVAALLWLTLQPAEQGWCRTDLLLCRLTWGTAVVAGLSVLLSGKRPRCSVVDVILLLWYLFVMGYAFVQTVYPVGTMCLKLTEMMVLYASLRVLFHTARMQEKWVVWGIVLCALYEAGLGVCQWWDGSSRHYLYPMTGSLFNPGPYAVYMALGLVLCMKLFREYRERAGEQERNEYIESGFMLLGTCFCMILVVTWSRASILAAALLTGLVWWRWLKKYVVYVCGAALVTGTLFYFLKQGSADGRLIIAGISWRIFCDHPLLGTGIGSFFHRYAEETAALSPSWADGAFVSGDVLDYAFNDWLRIGVEQGGVGLLFAFSLTGCLLHAMRKKGGTLLWGIFVLMLTSVFSYTLEVLPYQILMVLMLAYAGGERNVVCKGVRRVGAAIGFALPAVLVCGWCGSHIKARVEAYEEYTYIGGVDQTVFLKDYEKMAPLMREHDRFLFHYAKGLRSVGRYNDSNALLRTGTLVSNDPMFYVLQGNNYKDMGELRLAEEMYLKAFHVMPNRLYPLYRLMKLYDESGEREKACRMARRVMAFPVKVSSPATADMKSEAEKMLGKAMYRF